MDMDYLDVISDQELRLRLMEYGFPNQPVTSTTRKTLIKKLRNFMTNEKQKLRRETLHATRYSSDEEASDRESSTAGRRFNRTTIASPTVHHSPTIPKNSMPPPAPAATRRITSAAKRITSPPKVPPTQLRQSPRSNSVYVSTVFRTESDTDESDYAVNGQSEMLSSTFASQTAGYSPSKRRQLTTSGSGSFGSDHSYGGTSFSRSYNGSPLSSPTSPSNIGQPAATAESPFMSDFTRRLLNLRGATVADSRRIDPHQVTRSPLRSKYFNDSSFVGDAVTHQANISDSTSTMATNNSNVSVSRALRNFVSKIAEQYSLKQTFVPCILLSALIGFLAVVAFMYLTISPDLANTITAQETIYTPCIGSGTDMATGGYSCIERGHLGAALDVVKLVARELQRRIEFNRCVDASSGYMMSTKEVINLAIETHPDLHVVTMIKHLHNMQYLIKMNPQWRLRHCDISGNTLSFDDVCSLRNTQDVYFSIVNPRLPFTCSLYNKLQTFFIAVGGLGLCAIVAYACYFVYNIFVSVQRARKDKVNRLINEIINALIEKSAIDGSGGGVVMNHLRDKLIAPADRQSMEWAWTAAIYFLENNESRIQFEIGIRNGEDCRIMRWVDSVMTASPSGGGGSGSGSMAAQPSTSVKRWQSPAFDKTNKVKDPPTPCLKIRQMFDSYEANKPNLKQVIQDAILEKVGNDCKIYDIELDKSSCCVYVRCATPADAGMVHDRINGWWFDSSLVSIKFLRLDRYMSRFPTSSAGPMCLRPSNTKNLSMSDCTNVENGYDNNEVEMDGEDE